VIASATSTPSHRSAFVTGPLVVVVEVVLMVPFTLSVPFASDATA
jgi:hypothetical protein